MLPKTLDIKFLNEKASKVKTYLKKINQILDLGKEEFEAKPIYEDRIKYYLVVLNDEIEEISCHILTVIHNRSIKENCTINLANEEIFDPKLSRSLMDLVNFKDKLIKENLNYRPENMYSLVRDISKTLDTMFIKELSKIVKELKEKQPQLKIPVNLKRINQHISAISSNVKKLDTFLKYSREEFLNSPLFLDRSKYFLVVAIDSANWICKHIIRKTGDTPEKNCFAQLYEKDIIDYKTATYLQKLSNYREKLANPTENVQAEIVYDFVKESKENFYKFIKEIIKAIKD